MCFDTPKEGSCTPVTAKSIDNSYCFLQAANRLSLILYYFGNTAHPVSYLSVRVLQQAVSCMYHLFDNICSFGPDTNPHAHSLINALNANIPTLPPGLNVDSLQTLGTNQNNEVIDYLINTKGSDFTSNTTVTTLINTTIQNGYANMCEGDFISPILRALMEYNKAQTETDYTQALSNVAEAISTFNTYQSNNIKDNTMDGYTGGLYLFLNTPIGKIGMEDAFTLSTTNLEQLNLALVELGENSPSKCNYDGSSVSNCGALMQILSGAAYSEFIYVPYDCITNPSGLQCGGGCTTNPTSCSFLCTCNTGCPCNNKGTCDGSCIPDSSSCQGPPEVCATCPPPSAGTNTWYDVIRGWQTDDITSVCSACALPTDISIKKGEK